MQTKCETCHFWAPERERAGRCHVSPPHGAVPGGCFTRGRSKIAAPAWTIPWAWPVTDRDDYCKEWRERE